MLFRSQGVGGDVAAVPLVSRIHEGLVFSNRDTRTLLDKLSALLCSIAKLWQYEGQSTSVGGSGRRGQNGRTTRTTLPQVDGSGNAASHWGIRSAT